MKQIVAAMLLGTALSSGVCQAQVRSPGDTDGKQTKPPAATTEEDDKDIVVTGIRASLADAAQTKRDADQIIDVISAEDIGKLPDNNVAEALQRVTGVQIGRDTTGEGQDFQVRGISQNLVQVNGRTQSGGNADSRQVSFDGVSSQLFSKVEVIKSPTAANIEGALGAIVKLTTFKPFDLRKLTVSGQISGRYSNRGKSWDPRGSLLLSNVWHTTVGDIGLLVNFAYEKFSQNSSEFSTDFKPLTPQQIPAARFPAFQSSPLFAPGDFRYADQYLQKTRKNLDIALQWKPMENWTNTFNAQIGGYDFTQAQTLLTVVGTNNLVTLQTSPTPTFDTYTRPAQAGLFTRNPAQANASASNAYLPYTGTLTRNVLTSGKFGVTPLRTAENFNDGKQTERAYEYSTEFETGDIKLSGDANWSRVASDQGGVNLGLQTLNRNPNGTVNNNLRPDYVFDYNVKTDLPTVQLLYPAAVPNPLVGLESFNWNNFSGTPRTNTTSTFASQLDFSWKANASFISSIDFGVRYSNLDVRREGVRVHSPNNTQAAIDAAYIAQPAATTLAQVPALAALNLFNGVQTRLTSLTGDIPRTYVGYDLAGITMEKYLAALAILSPQAILEYDRDLFFDIREKTYAAYTQANLQGDLIFPFRGNLGVRVVRTKIRSAATPSGKPEAVERGYTDFLPSGNVSFNVAKGFFVRMAAARTLARPDPVDLSIARSLGQQTQARLGTSGDPYLDPYTANQADLSFEYYWRRTNLMSVALFYKSVDNILVRQRQIDTSVDFNGDGVITDDDTLYINKPVNAGSGTIKGVEAAIQYQFDFLPGPLSGFGTLLNYTRTNSRQNSGVNEVTGAAIPIVGLSKNSFNATLFYEKYGLSARVAYNYRDDSYAQLALAQTDTTLFVVNPDFGVVPNAAQYVSYSLSGGRFNKGYGQVDASISYKYKQFTVFAQAVNLTGALQQQYENQSQYLVRVRDPGTVFTSGIRFRF